MARACGVTTATTLLITATCLPAELAGLSARRFNSESGVWFRGITHMAPYGVPEMLYDQL